MSHEEQQIQNAELTLRQAQAEVDATIHALGGYWPPLANLARLFEECGELARAVNQTYGPKQRKPGEGEVAAREELGDALYVLLALANSLSIDVDDALTEALRKAQGRIQARQGAMQASESTDSSK
jgi:NTP pyrophosphatase (non-canonical NTP hydrolase)